MRRRKRNEQSVVLHPTLTSFILISNLRIHSKSPSKMSYRLIDAPYPAYFCPVYHVHNKYLIALYLLHIERFFIFISPAHEEKKCRLITTAAIQSKLVRIVRSDQKTWVNLCSKFPLVLLNLFFTEIVNHNSIWKHCKYTV